MNETSRFLLLFWLTLAPFLLLALKRTRLVHIVIPICCCAACQQELQNPSQRVKSLSLVSLPPRLLTLERRLRQGRRAAALGAPAAACHRRRCRRCCPGGTACLLLCFLLWLWSGLQQHPCILQLLIAEAQQALQAVLPAPRGVWAPSRPGDQEAPRQHRSSTRVPGLQLMHSCWQPGKQRLRLCRFPMVAHSSSRAGAALRAGGSRLAPPRGQPLGNPASLAPGRHSPQALLQVDHQIQAAPRAPRWRRRRPAGRHPHVVEGVPLGAARRAVCVVLQPHRLDDPAQRLVGRNCKLRQGRTLGGQQTAARPVQCAFTGARGFAGGRAQQTIEKGGPREALPLNTAEREATSPSMLPDPGQDPHNGPFKPPTLRRLTPRQHHQQRGLNPRAAPALEARPAHWPCSTPASTVSTMPGGSGWSKSSSSTKATLHGD